MVESKKTKDMLGRDGLISVDKAIEILTAQLNTVPLINETIPLSEAFDRVLAEPLTSPENLPAASRSTMDGYAVRAADTFGASQSMPCYLDITGEVLMGEKPVGELKKGGCYKIPTGGLIPTGADSVVMFEDTVPVDDTVIEIVKGVGSGSNLIKTGEDIAKNAKALPAGHLLRPQDLGLLAGLGISEVNVFKRIRVAIVSTGDEIIPFTGIPQPGQIRNINAIALAGMVRRAGALYTDYGIVSDKQDVFFAALEEAIKDNDIVLFSGGSSVGVKDLGERAVENFGPPGILVHGVTLKPGKPILIGSSGNTPVFGLPGHPVSALVCFDLFVKPAITLLRGISTNPELPILTLPATLSRNINSAPGRRDLVRVTLQHESGKWVAYPILGKSGSISTLSRANGYFIINEESQGITENSNVKVYIYQ